MKRRTMITALLLAAGALGVSGDAGAGRKKKVSEVDPLALARVLLRDGFPDRALASLAELKLKDDAPEWPEVHRVRGLAEHELGRFGDAVRSFQAAIAKGETSAATWYSLASAQHGAGDYVGAVGTLSKSPPELWERAGAYRLEAAAHYQLGDKHAAYRALDRGHAKIPDDLELARQRARLLIDLGLHQAGVEAAQVFLVRTEATPGDYLALATALAAAKRLDRAAVLLEQGVLRFPAELPIRKQLARTYFEMSRPLSAAAVLHPVALLEPESALHAGELYRRAGKPERALRMNGMVLDQVAKLRQRLNLLIELERYEEAAALDGRLSRLGLLGDQRIIYALAYAHYLSGSFDRVEALLAELTDPALFDKGIALRSAIEACREDVWQCE